jgi:hypothetical protein
MIPALLGLVSKAQTLLDRLTATRAGYLDRLDAAISTRAAASVWTSTVAGRIDAAVSSRARKPVIQTGYVAASPSTSTGEDAYYTNVTITAVSAVADCVVLVQGPGLYQESEGGFALVSPTGRLTSTTNLRLACPAVLASPLGTLKARWTVIDYGG